MKSLGEKINFIFGWGVYVCLLAGGITFFGFMLALLIGGDTGQSLSIFLHRQYFPLVIRATSFIIILGLIGMYVNHEQALSLAADKKAADNDIKLAQKIDKQ